MGVSLCWTGLVVDRDAGGVDALSGVAGIVAGTTLVGLLTASQGIDGTGMGMVGISVGGVPLGGIVAEGV